MTRRCRILIVAFQKKEPSCEARLFLKELFSANSSDDSHGANSSGDSRDANYRVYDSRADNDRDHGGRRPDVYQRHLHVGRRPQCRQKPRSRPTS